MKIFDKKEIQEKLTILSKTKPPKELAMGAMCYKVANFIQRAEYICPECNQKTLYTDHDVKIINDEIPECRKLVQSIKKLNINLIEKEFCKKCSPQIESPCLKIKILYKNNEEHLSYINSTDLVLLTEFLDEKLTHTDKNDFESPLKDYLPRIQQITGINF